ncbi:sensor histidine kinase [Amycolatopsis nigrescens]|uniref:sensor histidine kinase n=1 Tax=Amycolatopsis nigrescens TaxID=381445 RepID=UPI000477A278|nr:sensor histidine kinase [Amycolatopsis nigrescens]
MRTLERRPWSVARQLLVLQVLVLAVLVASGLVLAYLDAQDAAESRATDEVVAVATTVAGSPALPAALTGDAPSRQLQPFAERIRVANGVDFITIMSPDGIRYTHPNPALIGQRFLGNTADALRGKVFTETYTGTLGASVRAVVPVFGPEGDHGAVIALVSVGITVQAISTELRERLWTLFIVAGAVLAAGIGGSVLVSARLRRQTRGVAPAQLSRMFEYYEAILHAVREGLVLVDANGKVALCNDGARELLGLGGELGGKPVAELDLAPELAATFTAAEPHTDEIHVTDSRVLLVNTVPVRSRDRAMGTVVTLRDHTDLQTLTGELDTVRGFTESLRSQAHEASNRLHTVVSLVEIGKPEQAVEFATAELAIAQRLTDRVLDAVTEPVLAALLLGKAAEASERGVELELTPDTAIDDSETAIPARDLVTVLGNLIDNAIDAAVEGAAEHHVGHSRPKVVVTAKTEGDELLLRVADTGRGISEAAMPELFRRGWSTKPADGAAGRGLGLALVGQAVRRHGGTIEVGGTGAGAVFVVRLPAGREAGS